MWTGSGSASSLNSLVVGWGRWPVVACAVATQALTAGPDVVVGRVQAWLELSLFVRPGRVVVVGRASLFRQPTTAAQATSAVAIATSHVRLGIMI